MMATVTAKNIANTALLPPQPATAKTASTALKAMPATTANKAQHIQQWICETRR